MGRTIVTAIVVSGGIAALAAASAPSKPPFVAPISPAPFELVVNAGETLIVDTSTATLTDKNGQVATFVEGNVFLDSLEVKAGGTIVGQGPHSLRFFVTGDATVAGTIRADGAKGPDVATLLTASSFTQPGGAGVCGGGTGGTGNPDITKSSIRGGAGFGSWNSAAGGGIGGESSLIANGVGGSPCFEAEDRHPAGGGGGSFTSAGESGDSGTSNSPFTGVGACTVTQGISAVNPATYPHGGAQGNPPFTTTDPTDDFYGIALYRSGNVLGGSTTQVVSGPPTGPSVFSSADAGRWISLYRLLSSWEDGTAACNASNAANPAVCFRSRSLLRRIATVVDGHTITVTPALPKAAAIGDVWKIYDPSAGHAGEFPTRLGGQGGGAGGNAIGSQSATDPNYGVQDKSGAGGGGGGGVIELLVFGKLLVSGLISASGGDGGAGENTIFLDRIGGGSGGGSGGMIRIQSATSIDLTGGSLLARGGRRGAGQFQIETDPAPPALPNGLGHGGRGGKGAVQVHAPLDAAGNPMVTFSSDQPVSAKFDPSPTFAVSEFLLDPARVRALWFGTLH